MFEDVFLRANVEEHGSVLLKKYSAPEHRSCDTIFFLYHFKCHEEERNVLGYDCSGKIHV
jgi:hypothetical protein